MIKYVFAILFLFFSISLMAQTEEIYINVDKMPEFPGGQLAFIKYMNRNLRYPKEAKRNKISGSVFVSFVINKEGKVVDPKILTGLSEVCDKEALRIITKMPKWNVGLKGNTPVAVKFNMPIQFKLNE